VAAQGTDTVAYLHPDISVLQEPKHAGNPCGDVVECVRAAEGTSIILADGLGHGARAHLAAQFCVGRIAERLRGGASLRKAFTETLETMEANRGGDLPWAAFSVARILPEGNCTVLSYEAPGAAVISRRHMSPLPVKSLAKGRAVTFQETCFLSQGDCLMLVSDGMTQAGIGNGLALGWTLEGVCHEANLHMSRGMAVTALPGALLGKAVALSGNRHGDDTSMVLARCRSGVVVNLLTGPPSDPAKDAGTVRDFLLADGLKIVCGGTTAGVVAREMDLEAVVVPRTGSRIVPPRYAIDGIDLATEGAICLNQLYNIMGDGTVLFDEQHAVRELYEMLISADRIRFTVGTAANVAASTTEIRQQGILTRLRIVPLLADKLRAMGKLVEVVFV
jgi:hypothetical protein